MMILKEKFRSAIRNIQFYPGAVVLSIVERLCQATLLTKTHVETKIKHTHTHTKSKL